MGKAGQRRTKKLIGYLGNLLANDQERFKIEWKKRLDSWADEIHARARAAHRGQGDDLETEIYAVFDRAEALLAGCGAAAEALVGVQTRKFLGDECARAFASVTCPELNRLTNLYRNYLLMKQGTHKPPR